MRIHLTNDDGVPAYRQIVQQVKYLVAAGRLQPGDELPAIRALAETLLINPNTVARAYRELEAAGVVTARRGAGTVVADGGSPLARKACLDVLSRRADALLAEARQMNVSTDDLLDIVRRRAAKLPPEKE